MTYSITIHELVNRPQIRSDMSEEFLNKMTDSEIERWEGETEKILLAEGVKREFPEWNVAVLAKIIDTQILYDLTLNNQKKK